MDNLVDKQSIQETVTRLFVNTDDQNWEEVHTSFAGEVLLDYTSMAGGEPVTLSPEQITQQWKQLLPGFDCTHHMISNFLIQIDGNEATVFHYGNAKHYLTGAEGGDLWVVTGTYQHHLTQFPEGWKIDQMTFGLKFLSGNNNLPTLAQERARHSQE